MSLADYAADDFGMILETFGESVTHRPLGVSDNGVELTAIVMLEHPKPEAEGGAMYFESGLNIGRQDSIVYEGQEYSVMEVGSPTAGRICVLVHLAKHEQRRPKGVT